MGLLPANFKQLAVKERMEIIHERAAFGFMLILLFFIPLAICLVINHYLYTSETNKVYWFISFPVGCLFFQSLGSIYLAFFFRKLRIPMLVKVFAFGGLFWDFLTFAIFLCFPALITFICIGFVYKVMFIKEWWRYKNSGIYMEQIALFPER